MAPVPVPSFDSDESLPTLNKLSINKIPFGEYLFKRIRQLGVKSIFGVPGDFNLNLLDHINPVDDLKWIGTCNELNAAYAADGYARFSKVPGVVITTFGVGELSAINGVSGAFAEYVPLLHIVGTSPTTKKTAPGQVHHLVPTRDPYDVIPDHRVYEKLVDGVCIAKESIDEVEEGMKQVDNILEQIVQKARPGYLFLPLDLQDKLVDPSRLSTPLNLKVADPNPELTKTVAENILARLYASTSPVIIGDILTDRFQASTKLREFVTKTDINNYSTPMGKSALEESNPSYIADYNGKLSNPGVQAEVESSDCVLHFGSYLAETNTGQYSTQFNPDNLILLTPFYVRIGQKLIRDVNFTNVLDHMLSLLDVAKVPASVRPQGINTIIKIESPADISQSFLAEQVQKYIQEDDVIISETCSFQFAFGDIKLPKNSTFISQSFYLSIGYTLPATLGVGLAMKDAGYKGRLILFEGDGSAQMTVQEFSSYMKYGIKPTVFLLNNNGYTVERIIHGANEGYNDIQPNWDWCTIFKTFGDSQGKTYSRKIATKDELTDTLKDAALAKQDKIQLYEVILDKLDVPWRFDAMVSNK